MSARDASAIGHQVDEGRLPVLDAVKRAVVARPGLKTNLSAVKATVEAMMADGWTKLDEHAIRADERENLRPSNRLAREVAMASIVWLASDGNDDAYDDWKSKVDQWKESVLDGE